MTQLFNRTHDGLCRVCLFSSAYGSYLLSGEIPLGFDEVVFALGEDRHIILLHNQRIPPLLDQLQVDGVRLVCFRGKGQWMSESVTLDLAIVWSVCV